MIYIEHLIRTQYHSVRAFADNCGIANCTIHHYITGTRFPSTDNFMTMASALNVTAEDLYNNWFREVKHG